MEPQEIVFCKGGGCTAKLGPGILAKVLNNLPKTYDPTCLSVLTVLMMQQCISSQMIWQLSRHWIFPAYGGRSLYFRSDRSSQCFK